jgi:glucosyl-3-phosphoglycerate phosphatase
MLLIRHAESEWNRIFGPTRIDAGIFDPPITPEGAEQARAAAEELRHLAPSRIIASPYRRTLQTATLIAERLGLPITVDAMVRERCAFSCDQGTLAATLREEWPQLDLSHLPERWWGSTIESMESLARRAQLFLERARALADRDQVIVVSHWGFIRGVTGVEAGNLEAVRMNFDRQP